MQAMAKTWTNPETVQLIECCEQNPIVWDLASAIHKDRVKREAAWRKIAETLDVDVVDAKKKFRNLRTTFKEQEKKAHSRKKYSSGTDETFIPSWPFYSMMMFIGSTSSNKDSERMNSMSDDAVFEAEGDNDSFQTINDDSSDESPIMPQSHLSSTTTPHRDRSVHEPMSAAAHTSRRRKRVWEAESVDVLINKCLKVLSEQQPPQPVVATKPPVDATESWAENMKAKIRFFEKCYGEIDAHDFMDSTTQFMISYQNSRRHGHNDGTDTRIKYESPE